MSESTAFPVRPAVAGALSATAAAALHSKGGIAMLRKGLNPASIWPRILVLLALLIGLKLVLIGGQGQSLYEMHWRLGGLRVNKLNFIAFYCFVVFGGLSLVVLARSCQSAPTAVMRRVNLAVVALGLSFILLTFHNGDKNYVYPVLSGVLSWTSLVPYLTNSFFFNEPFLAGWIFVYGGIYYVLARTGRERQAMWVTVAFACAYGLLYLDELILRREELLIINCVGALSLLMAKRSGAFAGTGPTSPSPGNSSVKDKARVGTPLSMRWLLVPLAWTLFFCWVVARFDNDLRSHATVYFLGLLGLTVTLFATATFVIRKAGNLSAWSWFVPFFFVAFFLLADTYYPSAVNYNHLLVLALTAPRYFVGELAWGAILALTACLYRWIRPRSTLWWLDIAGLALVVCAGIDLRLSQIMGVRLGWDVLSFSDSPKMMLKMAKPYLPGALAAVLLGTALYGLALRAIRIWNAQRAQELAPDAQQHVAGNSSETPLTAINRLGMFYIMALFISFALLGQAIDQTDKAEGQALFHLVQTSPLWRRVSSPPMSRDEFVKSANAIGLGDFSRPLMTVPIQPRRDLNVLVVFMESSYNKHLSLFGSSEETQPLLSKYKERMELFPNFFSTFASSIHARFATFTSLYPVQDFRDFTSERVPVKSLFEVLHDQGYTCSLFYSSYFDYTGFRDFLKHRDLDAMYDADTMPGQRTTQRVEWGLLEEETLHAICNQLQKYAQSRQRFFLTYVPAAPHYPYDKIPAAFQKHKMKEVGDFTPLYLNELLYMDWVIASILDQLKDSGLLDQTLVIITNDHGEMLGGTDKFIGHGWRITPQLANTPLIVMDPQRPGFQINETIGTQVDFLPSALDRLNIPLPADQLYEGQSLYSGPHRAQRLGYLNSNKQFGIISGDQILLGDREDNRLREGDSDVCLIRDEGAKTLFDPTGQLKSMQDRQSLLLRFEAFQQSLLRNYELYCAALRQPHQQAKRSGN